VCEKRSILVARPPEYQQKGGGGGGGGGGTPRKNRVGVRGPLPKTLTLFMTNVCNIPYTIYDLTKNLKP